MSAWRDTQYFLTSCPNTWSPLARVFLVDPKFCWGGFSPKSWSSSFPVTKQLNPFFLFSIFEIFLRV